MTKEQKELLMRDLCSRLGTNLVCSIYRVDDFGVGWRSEILSGYCKGDIWDEFYFGDDCGIAIDNVSKIKPYLFPLSTMTEEQKNELQSITIQDAFGTSDNTFTIQDFYSKYHLDYRGLISMGLANDATNLNIY